VTPIAATEVLRILQRGAEGDTPVTVLEADMLIELEIDGWNLVIADDAGEFDGVYYARSPDGVEASLETWTDCEPTDLLAPVHERALWQIIRLLAEDERRRRQSAQRQINEIAFGPRRI